MSVENVGEGELFTVRTYKETYNSPFLTWSNTYEIQAAEAGQGEFELAAAAMKLLQFERAISQDTSRFTRATVSTWEPDEGAYDVRDFVSVPVDFLGAVTSPVAAESLPLDVCLFLRRDVKSGRYGKLFIRRALDEADVTGNFGPITMEPAALTAVAARVVAAEGEHIEGFLGDAPESGFNLVMAGLSGQLLNIRKIRQFVVSGVRRVKYNNRYFDRA
jgi:hypothetical protein